MLMMIIQLKAYFSPASFYISKFCSCRGPNSHVIPQVTSKVKKSDKITSKLDPKSYFPYQRNNKRSTVILCKNQQN